MQVSRTRKTRRLINPSPAAARSNPAHLLVLGPQNPHTPHRKVKSMKTKARPTQARKTSPKRPTRKGPAKAKRNPALNFRAKSQPKPKRNPSRRPTRKGSKLVNQGLEMAKLGAPLLAGMVLTQRIPQMLLKANNTGWKGYLANGAMIPALYAAFAYFGKSAAGMAALGGFAYLSIRFLTENTNPLGRYLREAGLGDYNALGGRVSDDYTTMSVSGDRPDPYGWYPSQFHPALQRELDAGKALPAPAPIAAGSLEGYSMDRAAVRLM